MVLQQGEVEAVLVGARVAALLQGLRLHQGAVGVVQDHEAFGAGPETGEGGGGTRTRDLGSFIVTQAAFQSSSDVFVSCFSELPD